MCKRPIIKNGLSICAAFFVFSFFIGVSNAQAATCSTKSDGGGLWSAGATWTCGATPTNADAVIILSGDTVTVGAAASANTIDIQTGGVLNFTGAFTLVVDNAPNFINGTMTGSSGIFRLNNALVTLAGTGSTTIAKFRVDQGFTFTSTTNLTINNLIENNKKTITNDGTVTVNGNITSLGATSAWVQGTNATLNINGTFLAEAGGAVTASAAGNTINYSDAGQTVFGTTYNNLTLSGSGVKTLGANTTVNGILSMQSTATFALGGKTLTYGAGTTLEYKGSAAQTTGAEFLAAGVPNLTINNGNGVTAGGNLTVTGTLNLSTANPSSVKGALDMGANTLTMGASATTIGQGDVTGIVKRTTLVAGTTYTFGNQYTTINFRNTGTLPTEISFKTTIGAVPSWKNDGIQRTYDIVQSGSVGVGSYASLNVHYLDSELNGNTENTMVKWFTQTPLVPASATEYGRSNYDATNNWVGTAAFDVSLWPTGFNQSIGTLGLSALSSATWTGASSVAWSNPANWSPNGIPSDLSDVVIPGATTTPNDPTLNPALSVGRLTIHGEGILNSAAGSVVTISGGSGAWSNNGGTFNPSTSEIIFTSSSATISGATNFYNVTIDPGAAVTMESGGMMRIGGTMTNNGIWRAAQLSGTTVEYNGGAQTVLNPNGLTAGYDSLILSGSGAKTMPGTALNILGDFTVTGTVSVTAGNIINTTGNLSVGFGTTFTMGAYSDSVGGNLTNHGTFTATGATIDIGGNFSSDNTFTATGGTMTVGGNFTNSNTFTATGSNITFDGTAAQAIGGTVDPVFNTLNISNTTAAVTANRNFSTGGTMTVISGATFNASTYVVSGGGTFTLASGGILGIGSPAGITSAGATGNIQTTGRSFDTGATYIYNAIGAQATGNGLPVGAITGGVTVASTATVTATNPITVNGSLVTQAGGTLNMGTNQLLGTLSTLTNGGTISTQSISGNPLPDGLTWGGTVAYDRTGGAQHVAIGTYNNLTIGNTGATTWVNVGDITVNGTFITTAGGTLDLGNSQLLGSPSSVSSDGTIKTISISTTAIPSEKTWGGTILYNNPGGNQIIVTGTYSNLSIDQGGGPASLGGNVNVSAVLTLTSGIVSTGVNTLYISTTGGSVSRSSGHINGNLKKRIATGSFSKTFEIGDATDYTPVDVSFNNVTVAGDLTAMTTVGAHPNIAGANISATKNVNRYWTVTNSGTTLSSYDTVLNFVAGDVVGGANTSNFIVGKYSGGVWTYPTVGTKNATNTQATGLTSFSDFVIGESGATVPIVGFAATSSSGSEAATPALLAVVLSATSSATATVDYAVTGGTATGGGVDYTLAAGTLTFAPGDTSKNISAAIVNDSLYEYNETIIVTLSNASSSTLGATTTHTFTILDNDSVPSVTFASGSSGEIESISPALIAVNLSAASGITSTVDYAVTGGTATGGGVDYTLAPGTLTFSPGETAKSISVTIVNDVTFESNETIIIGLSNPTSSTLGATTTHTHSIYNNDSQPTVDFAATSTSGSEAATPALLTVNLSAASTATASINYAVTGGTATGGGVDYTLAAGVLNFSPGETTKDISAAIVNDLIYEGNETIIVTLSNPSQCFVGATSTHTYTIVDNDTAPVIGFTATSSSGSEASSPALLAVNLTGGTVATATVDYTVTGGTATGGGVDYTLAAGTLTFSPGDTSKNISATIVNDTIYEGDETFVVTLSNATNSSLATTTHTYTIVENDTVPSVAFAAASSNGSEAASPALLAVNLSNASSMTSTVDYAVTGGSATGGGVDYTLAAGTLTFSPGDTTKNISATIINDAIFENNETIVVTLSNPASSTLGATTGHTYTINNDNSIPVVGFDASSSSGSEATTPANIAVSLSVASEVTSTVNYAVTGGAATGGGVDYTLAAGTLTFSPGDTAKNISATIVEDVLIEGSETIIITLSGQTNATLGTSTHTYTIIDNEAAPDVAFALNSSGGNENVTPALLAVNLSGASSATATVDYAVTGGTATGGGVDYALAAGTLTFSPGDTIKNISAAIVDDSLLENNETIIVTLSNPTAANLGATTTHTYTISDNDPAPSVEFVLASSNGSEGTTPANLAVNLSTAAGVTSTVDYAVTGGTAVGGGVDYTLAAGTLSFSPGQTTKNISITIVDDALVEGDLTIEVTLSNATASNLGATIVHTFTISENDVKITPTLSITNSPVTHNGSAQSATVVGSVAGVVSDIKYDGSGTAPTNVGTYAVTADFAPTDGVHYDSLSDASAGNFVINPAGGVAFTAPIAIGDGLASFSIPMFGTMYIGNIGTGGINISGYIGSTANISIMVSGSGISQNHTIKIIGLDLVNRTITIQVDSVPQIFKINLSDVVNVDLNGDMISDMSVKFAALTVNRAELTVKSLVAQAETVIIAPPTVSKYTFARNLKYGMSGTDVKELQKFLNANGFFVDGTSYGSIGKETTYFGYYTKAALTKFQKSRGITLGLGIFGTATRNLVNTGSSVSQTPVPSKYVFARNLKYGMSGTDVKELQKFLNVSGFSVDGSSYGSVGKETTYFGSATKAALIKYQQAHGITTGLGSFGLATRTMVNSAQ